MQFTEVRSSGFSKVVVADAGTATSPRPSFFHPRGLLPVLIAASLLVFTTVRADMVAGATEVIKAQLSPILDSLAQASASMAIEDRATASMQLGLAISLANGLSSTIQAPEMVATLGKKAKSFQKGVTRFQDRLTKAKTLLDKPVVANAAASKATKATKATKPTKATKAMLKAVSEGERLRRQMLAVPAGPADTIAPSVPGGVTAYASSPWQSVIYWNASTDAGGSTLNGYKVYRGGTLVATTATASYTDSGLSAGTQYCYTVLAYDNAGNNSSASDQACVTTPANPAPVPDVGRHGGGRVRGAI